MINQQNVYKCHKFHSKNFQKFISNFNHLLSKPVFLFFALVCQCAISSNNKNDMYGLRIHPLFDETCMPFCYGPSHVSTQQNIYRMTCSSNDNACTYTERDEFCLLLNISLKMCKEKKCYIIWMKNLSREGIKQALKPVMKKR